jgi:G:T-mismatch repair DNA endonuclease (very short patch repair protein)
MTKKKKRGKIGKLFKKMNGTSKLETKFAEILDKLEISYQQHYTYKKREYDFLLIDHNILIETHGCFYHCCKTHFKTPNYSFQKRTLINDQLKVKNVKFGLEFTLLTIWEHELDDINQLIKKITDFIETNSKTLLK